MELLTKQNIGAKHAVKKQESFFGKRGSPAFFAPVFVQAKLTIGPVDDPYEREADSVADRVMRMSDAETLQTKSSPINIQRKCSHCEEEEKLQRKCSHCEEEEKVQMKGENSASAGIAAPPVVHDVINSGGQPLDAGTRGFMESRFGYDFGKVQVHNDSLAHRSSAEINALAYTHGNHVVFGDGQYEPNTSSGKKLLAHELTHTIQQEKHNDFAQRSPTTTSPTLDQPIDPDYQVENIIRSKYPDLINVFNTEQIQRLQNHVQYRTAFEKYKIDVDVFNKETTHLRSQIYEGIDHALSGDSAKVAEYEYKLKRLHSKNPIKNDKPIDVKSSGFIDPAILDAQPWNIQAEAEFRGRWTLFLSQNPIRFVMNFDGPIDDLFTGIWCGKIAIHFENGMITFKSMYKNDIFFSDYFNNVTHSPLVKAIDANLEAVDSFYDTVNDNWKFEVDRKNEFPVVAWTSEKLSLDVDIVKAQRYLPAGKKYSDMTIWQIMDFLKSLSAAQKASISRDLPDYSRLKKAREHYSDAFGQAITEGKYEAVALVLPYIQYELETILEQTQAYNARTMEGATTAVQALEVVKAASKITLTILGGVAGKAAGLLGVSLGSGGGAALGTMTQEAAEQLYEGRFDPGSILLKGGKDGFIAFMGSLIGGALASKFQSLVNLKLATQIPNQFLRTFLANRFADVASGVIITPMEILVNGMIEGKWPKSMDDMLDQIADSAVKQVIIGGGIEIGTHAWGKFNSSSVAPDPPMQSTSQQSLGPPLSSQADDGILRIGADRIRGNNVSVKPYEMMDVSGSSGQIVEGISNEAALRLQAIAKREGLVFRFRPVDETVVRLRELGHPPKLEILKMKTISKLDVALGASESNIGKVGFFEPRLPENYGQLEPAMQKDLLKRYRDRMYEQVDYDDVVKQGYELKNGKKTFFKWDGQVIYDPKTKLAFTGDYDLFDIRVGGINGENIPFESLPVKLQRELEGGVIEVQHPAAFDWQPGIGYVDSFASQIRGARPGNQPLVTIDQNGVSGQSNFDD